MAEPGASFIVPVHNGEPWLDEVFASILAQRDGRPFEIIAIDDASTDRSPEILARWAAGGYVRLVRAPVRGAAAAMNQGIREARHPVICLVDQDVVLMRGWLAALLPAVLAPGVGAAQGRFVTDPQAPIVSRVAGMDLEQRYAAIGRDRTNHVCTGNSAYRAEALRRVGLFDESFGYGYDNDMSYRLADAGYELRFCPDAKSVHRWRETLRGLPRAAVWPGLRPPRPRREAPAPRGWRYRVAGTDDAARTADARCHRRGRRVPRARCGGPPVRAPWLWLAGIIVGALALERLVAGVRAAARHRDPAGLLFVPIHLLRDAAWSLAIVVWTVRRLLGRARRPWHSMGTK